jgi:hypothetical protein
MTERDLSDLLERTAERVAVSPPPISAIVAGAAQHRRRRAVLAAVTSVAAVVAVIIGTSFLADSDGSPTPQPAIKSPIDDPTPAVKTAHSLSPEFVAKLHYVSWYVHEKAVQQSDVPISEEAAIERANQTRGATRSHQPVVAALGKVTNTGYGRRNRDGHFRPFIKDRAAWVLIYDDVQTANSGLGGGGSGPRGRFKPTPGPDQTFHIEIAMFIDAHTGKLLPGMTSLIDPGGPDATPEETREYMREKGLILP